MGKTNIPETISMIKDRMLFLFTKKRQIFFAIGIRPGLFKVCSLNMQYYPLQLNLSSSTKKKEGTSMFPPRYYHSMKYDVFILQ